MANEPVRSWNPWAVLIGIVVLAAVVVGGFVLFGGDDDEDDPATTTTSEATTTTSGATTTTEATTTTTEPGITDEEAATVVWPDPFGDISYDDPLDAVASFAEDFVGYTDPVYGDLLEGDPRSGEVVVSPVVGSVETTVLVRQMSDDAWYVIGSTSPNIEVDEPEPGATVANPIVLSGRARAFEGTVQVAVHERGVFEPIGQGFVTGSGGEDLGPFSGEVAWEGAGVEAGVVLFTTYGGEDGVVWEVVAIPVALTDAG